MTSRHKFKLLMICVVKDITFHYMLQLISFMGFEPAAE